MRFSVPRRVVALLATVLLVGGCSAASDERASPDETPVSATVTPSGEPCDYSTASADPKLGGPLWDGGNSILRVRTRVPPGTLQDAFIIPLDNEGSAPVLLDKVLVMAEKDASELRFEGAFVASAAARHRVSPASDHHRLTPVHGYCLPPLEGGAENAPTLVLRIGPSLRKDRHGFKVSRNNNVSPFYQTSDGQRHVAVYPERFEYPN